MTHQDLDPTPRKRVPTAVNTVKGTKPANILKYLHSEYEIDAILQLEGVSLHKTPTDFVTNATTAVQKKTMKHINKRRHCPYDGKTTSRSRIEI